MGQNASPKEKVLLLKVKGLSCSFCAYGLEKKLKKDPKVQSIKIDIEKGLVFLKVSPNYILFRDQLKKKVDEAGFTLEDVTIVQNETIEIQKKEKKNQ
jgi:mercuric ion binding protein